MPGATYNTAIEHGIGRPAGVSHRRFMEKGNCRPVLCIDGHLQRKLCIWLQDRSGGVCAGICRYPALRLACGAIAAEFSRMDGACPHDTAGGPHPKDCTGRGNLDDFVWRGVYAGRIRGRRCIARGGFDRNLDFHFIFNCMLAAYQMWAMLSYNSRESMAFLRTEALRAYFARAVSGSRACGGRIRPCGYLPGRLWEKRVKDEFEEE